MKFPCIVACLFVIGLLFAPAYSTTYHISSSTGDDSLNNGLSEATPWKTLLKVNGSTFCPGDSILLKRGNSWRGQLLVKNSGATSRPIVFSAYGFGANPTILGSVDIRAMKGWQNEGNNVWYYDMESDFPEIADVANLIFNNGAFCGTRDEDSTAFNRNQQEEGAFYWDKFKRRIRVKSLRGNPGKVFTAIECAYNSAIIEMDARTVAGHEVSNIIINAFNLKYGGIFGINTIACDISRYGQNSIKNIQIKNCDISFIGGALFSPGCRYGNGIQFFGNASDCSVDSCIIHDVYDAALTNQCGEAGIVQENIFYRNNILCKNEFDFEFWNKNGTTKNIHFEHNTCISAGGAWSHCQRWGNFKGYHLLFYSNENGTVENFYVRDNIFCKSTEGSIFIQRSEDVPKYVLDNNCYYELHGSIADIGGQKYGLLQFSKYQADWKKDVHSIFIDPARTTGYGSNLQPVSTIPGCEQ